MNIVDHVPLLLPAATANWVSGREVEGWMGKGENRLRARIGYHYQGQSLMEVRQFNSLGEPLLPDSCLTLHWVLAPLLRQLGGSPA